MVFYKLRHIPTGMFFKPAGYLGCMNLSKTGKTYNRKPSVSYLDKYITVDSKRIPVVFSEWEVVTYMVTEYSVQNCAELVD